MNFSLITQLEAYVQPKVAFGMHNSASKDRVMDMELITTNASTQVSNSNT